MGVTDPLVGQINDELDRALAGPVGSLLGADLAEAVRDRLRSRRDSIAGQLRSGDDQEVAGTVLDLLGAIWGEADPPEAWWRTPLGRACAASLGRDDSEAVTYGVAAARLGVARGTVSTWVQRGTLDRHPDGGVTSASVFARLARPGPGEGRR